MEPSKIGLTINDLGIADALSRWQLAVPVNQRSYNWEDPVETLLHDLTKAFDNAQPIYFLGTIVLTEAPRGVREVADGQQRLATISILLGAIRDYLIELGDTAGATQYQSEFLIKYDPPSGQFKPKLRLNVQDDSFFFSNILLPPADRPVDSKQVYSSNSRLQDAAAKAKAHVRNVTAALSIVDKPKRLYQWIEYLRESALVIAITVPPKVSSSFRMFETLNARGVRASQVDILKNFLFDKAPDSTIQVQAHWLSMMSVIDSYGGDDLVLTFIRHLWISQNGPTTLPELGQDIENKIRSERQAIDLVALLDSAAADYVALLSPSQSPRWANFPPSAIKAIELISGELDAKQIRPLMLAIARNFDATEASKAFQTLLSWSVRFLIVGGGGGGKLDRYYGLRAMEVTRGEIRTKAELVARMGDSLPNDRQFQEEFGRATVKRANLARYYMRSIELYRSKDPQPQLLINEDVNSVNLEHILPINPNSDWSIDQETAAAFHKRIGNMVLLGSKDNVRIGNTSFDLKKDVFKDSPFVTTREVAASDRWGVEDIKDRQLNLAKNVAKVWPI